jgi:thioredoxin-like negative regulator of GroEL
MKCPKCGFEQTEAAECARCGLLFARFEQMEARLRAVHAAPGGGAASPTRRLPLVWIGLALALATVGAVAWLGRSAPESEVAAVPAAPGAAAPARARRDASAAAARAAAAEDGGACPLAVAAFAPASRSVGGPWLDTADFEFAERQQRETGAPLLLYFRTDWCGYCRRLEQGLLAEPAVESFLSDTVVRCRVNPEESAEAEAIARRFRVTGYPTLYLAAAGVAPVRVSTYGSGTQALSAERFIEELRGDRLRLAQALVAAGDRTRRGGDLDAALELLDRAVTVGEGGARSYFYRGLARGEAGDATAALADFALAAELEPGNVDLFRQTERLLAREGRWADAAACWSLYLLDHPGSAEAERRRAQLRARAASG